MSDGQVLCGRSDFAYPVGALFFQMSEIEKYQFQIDQINQSLEADPTNESLLTLKQQLSDLISKLSSTQNTTAYSHTKSNATTTATKSNTTVKLPSNSKPAHNPSKSNNATNNFQIGDTCLCIYEDGHKYEAVIIDILPDKINYEIAFTGYNEIKTVPLSDLSPSILSSEVQEATQQKVIGDIKDKVSKKKKIKKEKKTSKTDQLLNESQSSWQSFSSKMKQQNIVKKLVKTTKPLNK